MTLSLDNLRYIRIGTADLAAATRFAGETLGLQANGVSDKIAYFRSDSRDYSLCFFEGKPEDTSVAFEIHLAGDLDNAFDELTAAGFSPRRGTDEEAEERRVKSFIAFRSKSGTAIEIVHRPLSSGWRFHATRDAGITGLQHVGFRSDRIAEDQAMWTDVLGARVSDWVGDVAFLRIDDLHHRVALYPSSPGGLFEVSFAVEELDQIMQNFYYMRGRQVRILRGPGRDPSSGQIFLSVAGPDGILFTLSAEMETVDEDRLARQYPFQPASFCGWGTVSELPEFAGPRT
jgi:2,3-dihydroxy-p-cumate/2,3-dihydroxybenzoate 3,4-dioxygenase